MAAFRVTSVSLFLVLTACSVGEVPIGGTPAADAPGPISTVDAPLIDAPGVTIDAPAAVDPATAFDTTIKPIFGMYGCNGCHPSLNKPDLSSYAKLTADAATYLKKPGKNSLLVTKGQHESLSSYFTDDQKKTIGDWIDTITP